MPHDVYHLIGQGSIIKYDKGTYSVIEGETLFDLHPSLPLDSQYCKLEDVYYTPNGKLNKEQLDLLQKFQNNQIENEQNYVDIILNKFKEMFNKFINLFK